MVLNRIREIVDVETDIIKNGLPNNAIKMREVKMMGFSDARLAILTGKKNAIYVYLEMH